MGHSQSVSRDNPTSKPSLWDIIQVGVQWRGAEDAAWRQVVSSPLLASAISGALGTKPRGVGNTYRFGISDLVLALAVGTDAAAIQKAERALRKGLAAEKATARRDLHLEPWEPTPLPLQIAPHLSLVVEGSKGSGLQSEIEVSAITPLSRFFDFTGTENGTEDRFQTPRNGTEDRFQTQENGTQDRFSLQENGTEDRFGAKNGTPDPHLNSSTPTHPSTTTHPPTSQEGVQGEGGEGGREILLKKFLRERVNRTTAGEAVSALTETESQQVYDSWEDLVKWVEADDPHKQIRNSASVVANRCATGAIRDGLARVKKITQLRVKEPAKAPTRPITPPRQISQPDISDEASRAWHGVREALAVTLPEETFSHWIGPLICLGFKSGSLPVLTVGGVDEMHRLWIEGSLEDEWRDAVASVGILGLAVEIVEDFHQNLAL